MLANKTFLFVDQSSPDFFAGTLGELLSITFLSDFGYLESFRRTLALISDILMVPISLIFLSITTVYAVQAALAQKWLDGV